MVRPSIIFALVRRQVLLFTRNPVRAMELMFWPIVQLLVWGFTARYFQQVQESSSTEAISAQTVASYLIGGIILWDALFRSQQGVAISFLEDVWTRNLLNVFAAPIRITEYLAASFIVGLLRVGVTAIVLIFLAKVAYAFNLFEFEWSLFAFYANLMMFGWSLGMISTALILRWGHAAESLAWAIPFMIQPFACVFYSIEILPPFMQAIAQIMPPAHVFEGMREALATGNLNYSSLFLACGLNLVSLTTAGTLFSLMLRTAREKGLLVKAASS